MPATRRRPQTACPNAAIVHPLELIPLFRRWPRSAARDLVYTLVWNSLFALAFIALSLVFDSRTPLREVAWPIFMFSQCIGLVIHVLFMIGDRLIPGIHGMRVPIRFAYYTVLPMIGVFVGYSIGARLLGYGDFLRWLLSLRGAASVLLVSFLISCFLMVLLLLRERAARAETGAAQEQARVAAAQREATTARLKLLEAQVEPHFLYNTLAHVVSLIDTHPPTAKRMIERLIALLRATAAAPDGQGTLAEQIAWLRAYLELLELRMGSRLQWRIDVPADLLALRVPPMVLQPVVENAIKHGLEPKVEGGRLDIVARRDDDGVHLTVRDSGLGFRATRAPGVDSLGLANLRARLTAWYGDAARVIIEDNPPAGACVSVVVPLQA
ncbi:MAG TPA: histidine kinase [Casimicrobiaceae bacterium]